MSSSSLEVAIPASPKGTQYAMAPRHIVDYVVTLGIRDEDILDSSNSNAEDKG